MTEKEIWNALKEKGFTDCAAAGIMGNFQAESAMRSNNVEDRCPMSDAAYTIAADNGTIDFIYDAYGYGLPQFTFWSLKRGLLNYCRDRGVSVGDAETQIDFLADVLQREYSGTVSRLQNAASPEEAAIIFLLEFEKPADQGAKVQQYRGNLALDIYKKYAGKPEENDPIREEITNFEVNLIQIILNHHGYGLVQDGILGEKTKSALQNFANRISKI